MTLRDLSAKDVIQLKTGENLGRIDDGAGATSALIAVLDGEAKVHHILDVSPIFRQNYFFQLILICEHNFAKYCAKLLNSRHTAKFHSLIILKKSQHQNFPAQIFVLRMKKH